MLLGNHRSVSATSTKGILLESILRNSIIPHLEKHILSRVRDLLWDSHV